MNPDRPATAPAPGGAPPAGPPPHPEDTGYRQTLKPRHLTMMALGSTLGTGLFLGTGGRLATAGPALFLAYALAGGFAWCVVRALAELILHRPTTGSFVSYAREFLGEKGAYTAGWLYFLNWSTGGVADITAAALYSRYWSRFTTVPQWVLALLALAVVLALNLFSVRVFGELEFWFAFVKVAALTAFMALGLILLATRHPVAGEPPGLGVLTGHGGLFPHGPLPVVLVLQGVVFAYAGIELVGVTAGETAAPRAVVPRAATALTWRIAVFYAGSVLLLALLLPWDRYGAGQSPFVTVLARIGVPMAGDAMNLVVLTAALSSLNSGLYSTGRILRSMALAGSAPRFTARMSRHGVPYGGVLLISAVCAAGVGLNYLVPERAFEIVLNLSALTALGMWSAIVLCHLAFLRRARAGRAVRPAFRLPLAPFTDYATLAFLLGIAVLMWQDPGTGRATVLAAPVLAAALTAGWFLVRRRLTGPATPPVRHRRDTP
ncbi:L-asparagine permease [Streptomyces sp. NRRL F-4489]|uniref:amino acid permease n=1 Tax=Streptomyces sp. NRRL F-4489 TaxID=1609095 RepID=UPI0007475C21|nr:amino acid permease [Streptomyces sp. NRRL F-4489]KUL37346.1 L-asparagine permease [Streptomyces sp. NRRL F-4489]